VSKLWPPGPLQLVHLLILINYLRIENAEGCFDRHVFIYLFIYLYACYSHNKKSLKPNLMKFGGMIGYYPGTI